MPALNFKKEFAEDILIGKKRQTVRAPRKDGRDHCKVGDTIKLYIGMRTKGCELLRTGSVTHTEPIRIEPTGMYLSDQLLFASLHSRRNEQTDDEFAKAQGFVDFMKMAAWFDDVYGLPFEGTVIYWNEPTRQK
jgi:hypothetical protein